MDTSLGRERGTHTSHRRAAPAARLGVKPPVPTRAARPGDLLARTRQLTPQASGKDPACPCSVLPAVMSSRALSPRPARIVVEGGEPAEARGRVLVHRSEYGGVATGTLVAYDEDGRELLRRRVTDPAWQAQG